MFETFLVKLIVFLVRLKLHLKRGYGFQFTNQKTEALYWFTDDRLIKMENGHCEESGVSLNWLLNGKCKVERPRIGAGY